MRLAKKQLLGIAILALALSLIGQKASAVQTRTLFFPGEGAWYVCRGYNVASHYNNQKYSIDLTTDPNSKGTTGCIGDNNAATGKRVYAPADGKIVLPTDKPDFILLKMNSGGCLQIGHLDNRAGNGALVSRGDYIGTVSAPNSKNNGNYAHLHLSAFPGACWINPVAFDDNNNFRISELPNLYSTSAQNAYSGTSTCSNQYRAEYYNDRGLGGRRVFSRCENWPINWDWGSGGPGNGVNNDNFSARWTGKAYFSSGSYTFIARSDDGIRVWLDGGLIIDKWFDQGPTEHRATKTLGAGNHSIKVEYYENGGGAVAQFRWVKNAAVSNIALNRPTWATSQESSYYPPYKGNDGNTGTRWSSDMSGGDEWWRVDLGTGKTYNTVQIRWETAYAQSHFVGWSDDGGSFTGYWYSLPAAGYYAYNIGSHANRYVAVLMRTRASCCGNFSFWEFEVLQKAVDLIKNPILLKPVSELETIQIPEGLIPDYEPETLPEEPTP